MYADKEYLAVGGSTTEGHGFGLFINNCLTNGRSSVSDTFENGVLGGETEFEIQTIEVIGFLSSCWGMLLIQAGNEGEKNVCMLLRFSIF